MVEPFLKNFKRAELLLISYFSSAFYLYAVARVILDIVMT